MAISHIHYNMEELHMVKNYSRSDELLRRRITGTVNSDGKGAVINYVKTRFGLGHNTYLRHMANPGDFKLETLRKIFDTCDFSDQDVLLVFGRKT